MARLNVGGYYKDKDGMTLRFAGMKNDTEGVFLNKSGDAVFVNVDEVEKFGDGGEVGEENKRMLMNQAVQFKHHAEELMKVLEKNEKIDAWVVAKAERAATDLSDITHYLDGRSQKMKWGGMYQEGGDIESAEHEMAEFDLDSFLKYIYPNVKDAVEMNGLDIDSEFIISKDMKIGYLPHYMYEHIDGQVNEFVISYFDGEEGLVGDIHIDLDTNKISLKFPDWGVSNNAMYAKGGKLPLSQVTEMLELSQSSNREDVMKAKQMFDSMTISQKKDFKRQLDEGDAADEGLYDGFLYLISDENKFAYGGYMAKGGEVRYKIKGNNFGAQIENGREFKKHIERAFQNQTSEHNYPQNFIQEIAYTGKIVKHDGSNYLKDYSYKDTLTKFEFLDNADFIKALSYLDRPAIRKFEDGGMMAKGGMTTMTIGVDKSNVMHPTYFVYNSETAKKEYGFKTREEAERYIKTKMRGKMGMGGATFSDKVRSISGSLEGRSVNPKYRSEYGRRYSKQEAKEAAQRIAGSMRKKGY